jgi:6-phosphogluconolactonase
MVHNAFWFAAAVCVAMAVSPLTAKAQNGTLRVYVGTYTGGDSEGIYVCELDRAHGTLSEPKLAAKAVNPSFLEIHPSGKFVYAVGEIDNAGTKGGAVSAFAVDADGTLTLINSQSSEGAGPCHVSLDAAGKHALVANYSSGSVACLPIQKDGSLGRATAFVQHEGSSVNPQRQEGPHAHSINLDAANHFAIAADLGLDKLLVYRFDAAKGTLKPNDPPSVSVAPGGGPRHFAFHPSGKFAYANNEMASSVTAFTYDAKKGALKELHTLPTLPADYDGSQNTTAETRVHPSGDFVYVSNRGHDSVAIFSVDKATGKLTAVGHQSTGGKTPRNFNIDPSGEFLLAANQDSGNIVLFRIDRKMGKLAAAGAERKVPKAVCIRFRAVE